MEDLRTGRTKQGGRMNPARLSGRLGCVETRRGHRAGGRSRRTGREEGGLGCLDLSLSFLFVVVGWRNPCSFSHLFHETKKLKTRRAGGSGGRVSGRDGQPADGRTSNFTKTRKLKKDEAVLPKELLLGPGEFDTDGSDRAGRRGGEGDGERPRPRSGAGRGKGEDEGEATPRPGWYDVGAAAPLPTAAGESAFRSTSSRIGGDGLRQVKPWDRRIMTRRWVGRGEPFT